MDAPCTAENPCIHWFHGLGFRPAVWANDYIGPRLDCPMLVLADDSPMEGKSVAAPLDPYAFIPPSVLDEVVVAAAGPPVAPTSTPVAAITRDPALPGWPGFPSWPHWPGTPGVIHPGDPDPHIPAPALVPLADALPLLLTGIVMLAIFRRRGARA